MIFLCLATFVSAWFSLRSNPLLNQLEVLVIANFTIGKRAIFAMNETRNVLAMSDFIWVVKKCLLVRTSIPVRASRQWPFHFTKDILNTKTPHLRGLAP